MKIDKTIESLKKLHQEYTEDVRLLTEKVERIKKALADATDRASQTAEALLALEGKSTQLKDMIAQALTPPSSPTLLVPETLPKSENDELPPPEPGFKWAKNKDGQDILIPIFVPDIIKSVGRDTFILPVVDDVEDFDNPTDFIDTP